MLNASAMLVRRTEVKGMVYWISARLRICSQVHLVHFYSRHSPKLQQSKPAPQELSQQMGLAGFAVPATLLTDCSPPQHITRRPDANAKRSL